MRSGIVWPGELSYGSSPAVSFPCGLQQAEASYRGRSLQTPPERENITMESGDNITDIWEPKLNFTETEERTAVNTTFRKTEGNETLLGEEAGEDGGGEDAGQGEGDELTPRIVGGMLEKPGGSPWQVTLLQYSFQLSL